jgi:hypothetical protein
MTQHPTKLTRRELYEKVWSQPIRTLDKEYGISDVGLKKTCGDMTSPRLSSAPGPRLPTERLFVMCRSQLRSRTRQKSSSSMQPPNMASLM